MIKNLIKNMVEKASYEDDYDMPPRPRFVEVAATFKESVKHLSALGISLKKVDDEYIVNFKNGKEATAYYTDSLTDAVMTGRTMAKSA